MLDSIETIVFDLDGTIYQNTVFHRDYIRFLTEDTDKACWTDDLIAFADDVFAGRRLTMNAFYSALPVCADTPEAYFAKLESALLPAMTYEEAISRRDLIYTGDAWAVVSLIGRTLGLLEGERCDEIYRRTREKMSADGMTGCARLKDAIAGLEGCCETILLSNSYEGTAVEFLRQLGFENIFARTVYSANKPRGMVEALMNSDASLFDRPEVVLTVGDHAFNDLMPLQRMGCMALWENPFVGINEPMYDETVRTPEELAEFLEALASRQKRRK